MDAFGHHGCRRQGGFFEGGTDAFIEDRLETGKTRAPPICAAVETPLNGQWHAFGRAQYSVN